MVNHRMTRGEANAVQTLVIEYHNFYRAWERGEVRKAVEAARRVRNVADNYRDWETGHIVTGKQDIS